MKIKHFLAGILALCAFSGAMADEPFRAHRYDALKATPVTSDQIVFIGNSITNMHEWWEAFGSDQRIINRGTSGGFSQEILDNLESFIDGKPAKIFLMIGTNDISTGIPYQTVVANIRRIIERVQEESPETKIHIQCILPRATEPQNTNNKAANAMLAELCDEMGVTFIDLWDDLQGIRSYGEWSADGLHLYAAGYRVWCRRIAQYIGDDAECVYQDSYNNINGGMSNSNGMRVSYFGMLPVKADDVLIIGDEMIHGGEWHELLRSDKIKSRGLGWGYGGLDISQHQTDLAAILTGNGNKVAPAKIFFYVGTSDKNTTSVSNLLDRAKELAPESKLYVISQIPLSSNANSAVVAFNNSIQSIAEQKGATYVDIYNTLLNAYGSVDAEDITANYLYGRGYVKVANKLAEYLTEEGVNPVTLEEYEKIYSMRTVRNSLHSAIDAAEALKFGDQTGQYPEAVKDLIDGVVNQAKALLNSPNFSAEAAEAAVTAINNAMETMRSMINMPKVSTATEEYLYTFCSTLRGSYYTTASGSVLVGVANGATTADRLWKFEKREDGSYDIVNYGSGLYVSPTASYNTQITLSATAPAAGWSLSYSGTLGMYTVYSGTTCQLNQTNLNAAVYNWYTPNTIPDRTDSGCQLSIAEFTGEVAKPQVLETGWYEIELANDLSGYLTAGTHHVLNAEDEFRQTNTNYYALRFTAPDEANPAKAYIHLTVNGSTYQFTGLCGHGIKENCTSDRASLSTDNPAVAMSSIEGAWTIGKWSDYSNTGAESPYVGKSSASNNSYFLTAVSPEALDAYDIYTVKMLGSTNGSEVGQDARVALDIPANKGIRKVFNGGTFFVTKGTELKYEDFAADANGSQAEPEITVDSEAMTITVDYTTKHDPNSAIAEVAAEADNAAAATYDLLGRKVNADNAAHGIYISNSRKTIR